MEMVNITSRLEEQLSKWEKLLLDIKYVLKSSTRLIITLFNSYYYLHTTVKVLD